MPFALKARALGRPLVDVPIDVGLRRVRIPPAARGAEVRPGIVDARTNLLATVDALSRFHHAVRVVLAGGECRRDAIGQKDQRVISILITPHATDAECHVVVRVDVEEAGEDVLVVAQLDHARSGRFRLRNRPVDRFEPAARNEDSLIARNVIRRGGKEPPATNDDGLLANGSRDGRRCRLRRGDVGGKRDGAQRVEYECREGFHGGDDDTQTACPQRQTGRHTGRPVVFLHDGSKPSTSRPCRHPADQRAELPSPSSRRSTLRS